VSGKVTLNGLLPAGATVTAVISAADNQGGANTITHTMIYDAPSDTWSTANLYPNVAVNYKSAIVIMIANHPNSSNVATYGYLP
jgi:hypothetical protein